jgi:hypothetical protein
MKEEAVRKTMKEEIAYADPSRGRIQVIPERLNVSAFYLSVHHDGDKLANVESGFDKI